MRRARTPQGVRDACKEIYEEVGHVEVTIHVQGAFSGCAGPIRTPAVLGLFLMDEELQPLLDSEPLQTVIIVPMYDNSPGL